MPVEKRKLKNYDKLIDMLKPGVSQAEIARRLGVHRSTITRALRKLDKKIPDVVTVKRAEKYRDYKFDLIDQQNKNTKILNELLDGVEAYIKGDREAFKPMQRKIEMRSAEGNQEEGEDGKGKGKKTKVEQKIETFDFSMDPRLLAVQIIRELREHMRFTLEVLNTIANAENILVYQRHVVEIMREMSPEIAEKFIARLRAEHAVNVSLITNRQSLTAKLVDRELENESRTDRDI
jgi:transcriptional regulator with XRE-family HTH domain